MMDKTDRVRSLNYSTQALEQLEVCLPLLSQNLPGIRMAHTFVAKQLHDSVKFLLPNCAELVDMTELRQAHVDMARLPYPVVALEAPGSGRTEPVVTNTVASAHPSVSPCA